MWCFAAGCRAWVSALSSSSWVRNRRDGVSVEAVFAGAAETVETVIDVCRKGPPHGRVDAMDQREGTAEELALRKQDSFGVLPAI